MIIEVYGTASQKKLATLKVDESIISNMSLMSFLVSNGITIASSCSGVGACKKCIINNSELSCQISLANFIKNNAENLVINISYL